MNDVIFSYLHGLATNDLIGDSAIFLHKFTYVILGAIFVWLIIVAKRKMFAFSLLFLSSISAWFIAHTLKSFFQSPRPFSELDIIPLVKETYFSFPSEHSAVFFALAIVSFFINKRMAIVLLILAIVIGISRVILGVHYPVDILGGFFVGSLVAFLFIRLLKRI